MATFDPAQRLDAPWLVAAINEQFDLGLSYLGPAAGGNVGAGYIIDRDGRRSVLTWQAGAPAQRHHDVADLLDVARAAGIPGPRYEHVLVLGDATAIVQELLPGRPPERATPELVEAMLRLNERFRGRLADRQDVRAADLHLRVSRPGFCVHETLAVYSYRTRALLARIRAIGDDCSDTAEREDLLHLDYQPANVLLDESGRLTGLVDWNGAGRGDADLDLVVLLFGLHAFDAPPATIAALEERLRATVAPERLRAYWAHLSLRMVDWAIRHHGPDDVTRWLWVAEPGLS